MKQPTRREALMYGVIGGFFGVSALDKGMQFFRERPVELEYIIHVMSEKDAEKLHFSGMGSWTKHLLDEHNGCLELDWVRGYENAEIEVLDSLVRDEKVSFTTGDLPLFVERPYGDRSFEMYVTHRGEPFHWTDSVHFLNDSKLLEELLRHAKKTYVRNVPQEYTLNVKNVTYTIHDTSLLTNGNADDFVALFKQNVLY